MSAKKAKRNKEESLLISYNSAEDRGGVGRSSESDDNVQPLDLPPTRLRRPRSRKIHVPSQSKTCYSPWNALQVIFVLFTVGTMISMMWFTIILKTSLESMKKRITSCKLAPLPCSLPVIIIFAINSEVTLSLPSSHQ